jgi:hypothetical protein
MFRAKEMKFILVALAVVFSCMIAACRNAPLEATNTTSSGNDSSESNEYPKMCLKPPYHVWVTPECYFCHCDTGGVSKYDPNVS